MQSIGSPPAATTASPEAGFSYSKIASKSKYVVDFPTLAGGATGWSTGGGGSSWAKSTGVIKLEGKEEEGSATWGKGDGGVKGQLGSLDTHVGVRWKGKEVAEVEERWDEP